jgi:hypothetical protein
MLFQLKIKDVHIRYEDDITIPGQLFALGVTVDSLTAQSCDDKWMPRFVGWDSGNTSFKLIELSTFAVYWDDLTDDQLLGGLSLDKLAVSMFYKMMQIGHDNDVTTVWMNGDARFDSWQVCASATISRISVGMMLTTHIHFMLRLRNNGVMPPQGGQCSGGLAVAVICYALRRSVTVRQSWTLLKLPLPLLYL